MNCLDIRFSPDKAQLHRRLKVRDNVNLLPTKC